jgi:hypothetical protein
MASTTALVLTNGFPRTQTIAGAPVYDQSISIVTSGTPPSSLTGPVSASTAITLPASGTYQINSGVVSINIYLNGDRLEYNIDWNTSGSGPNYTAFTLTFGLVVGDRLDLRVE